MANLPSYLRKHINFAEMTKKGIMHETYLAISGKPESTRCVKFKIYDKSKQMKNTVSLSGHIMRVEITLLGTERIKKSLGTNRFLELTDEIINDFFNNQMQKMIMKPFEKWKIEQNKYLVRLMKEQREKDIRHWQTNILRILQNEEIKQQKPILLDITEIMPLIDHLNLTARRKYDIRVNFRKQAKKYEYVFCNNDNSRMEEILTKITATEDSVKVEDENKIIRHIGGIVRTA